MGEEGLCRVALPSLLHDSGIFWRSAITRFGPESLTPQVHIYQLELYPLPNVSLPILASVPYMYQSRYSCTLMLVLPCNQYRNVVK